jgi:hypothetical protein
LRTPTTSVGLLLVQDREAMVIGVERLGQAKGVLRQNRKLQRPNDLVDDLVQPCRIQDESPQRMPVIGSVELGGRGGRERTDDLDLGQPLTVPQFVKDVVGANDSILQIGAAFTLEVQRLVDVERDHLGP